MLQSSFARAFQEEINLIIQRLVDFKSEAGSLLMKDRIGYAGCSLPREVMSLEVSLAKDGQQKVQVDPELDILTQLPPLNPDLLLSPDISLYLDVQLAA